MLNSKKTKSALIKKKRKQQQTKNNRIGHLKHNQSIQSAIFPFFDIRKTKKIKKAHSLFFKTTIGML